MERRSTPFEVFFNKYLRWVVRQAGRVVGEHDAEDVAQEVFVRLYGAEARGEFDPSSPPWGWLRTTTYWTAQDHRRRLVREQPATQDEDINPMDETLRSDAERALVVREQWAQLMELLETLEPDRRIVFVMSELDQMPLAEIAEILGLSPNTVSTRLRLARADFEAALTRKRAEERRRVGTAGALLLFPLEADALLRMARALPAADLPASTYARIWQGVQRESARRQADPGSVPKSPKINAQAIKLTTFVLGVVVGLLAAALDVHAVRHVAGDTPGEAVSPPVSVVVPPAIVDSVTVAPVGSTSSPPLPAASPDMQLAAELTLLQAAQAALEPPDPDPEAALRLLDRYAQRYPHSRRFVDLIARLRLAARRLAEQKR